MGNSWIIIGIAVLAALAVTAIALFWTRKHAESMRKTEHTMTDKEGMRVLRNHEESLARLVEKAQKKPAKKQ